MSELYNDYFTLISSGSGLVKNFRVILGGYKPRLMKSQEINKTIHGGLDISFGGVYEDHAYIVRVRETESESGFGSLGDLKTFFTYNTPTVGVLTLVDHYKLVHQVVMIDSFEQDLIGVELVGLEAWYMVNCHFLFVPEG
jgi:hypothetical protein